MIAYASIKGAKEVLVNTAAKRVAPWYIIHMTLLASWFVILEHIGILEQSSHGHTQ